MFLARGAPILEFLAPLAEKPREPSLSIGLLNLCLFNEASDNLLIGHQALPCQSLPHLFLLHSICLALCKPLHERLQQLSLCLRARGTEHLDSGQTPLDTGLGRVSRGSRCCPLLLPSPISGLCSLFQQSPCLRRPIFLIILVICFLIKISGGLTLRSPCS